MYVCLEGVARSANGRRGTAQRTFVGGVGLFVACCFSEAIQNMLRLNGEAPVSGSADFPDMCIHVRLSVVFPRRRQCCRWANRQLAFLFLCLVVRALMKYIHHSAPFMPSLPV